MSMLYLLLYDHYETEEESQDAGEDEAGQHSANSDAEGAPSQIVESV